MSTSDEDDLRTLEADLRNALQHQHADYERVRETQREIEALIERARALLAATEEEPRNSPGSEAGSSPTDG